MSTCLQFLSTRRRIFSFSLILVMLLVNFLPMGAVSAETPVFINEIHYDNTSTDAGEAIEIAGPAGTDLTGWQIVLYNGSGGAAYNTRTLAGAIPDMGGGYGFAMYDYPTNGIQNGSPDGIALIDNLGNVIQFLSYEGTFTAADGPAAGEMSVDIGVAEGSDTPANFSLQLTGSGTNYEDFSWAEPSAFTWLDFNNGQTIGGGSGGDPEDPEDPGDPEDPASVPMINEIRIDQGGTDNDEYFELAGVPGLSLDGYTYLVIGDGTGGSGVIEAVVDLSGQTIPSSGYFVAAEGSFTLGTADLIANLNFENGDNVTHLLVKDFTGSNGADLDTDDDGMLDSTLWTELVDSVALVQSFTSGELIYSTNTVGPDGAYVPGHAYRCWQGWEIGGFTLGTNDTPGAENLCPVSVALSEIRIDQGGTDNDEYFELAGAPGTALDGFTYVVIGDGTGASGVIESVTDLTGQVIPSSGFFVAAESTFTIGTADFIADLNFENSDNVTHLLVKDFTGSYGDDLDTDDDGVLDSMPWASVVDSVALVETVGSGDLIYSDNTVGPDGTFVPGHVYTCLDEWLIGAFEIVGGFDTPGAENLCGSQCGRPATLISAVQGSGGSTPYFGEYVTVEGVVTADFQAYGQLGGFFLQEEVSDQDSDPLTSEGIYVYNYSNAVSVGDVVRVTAEATEYYGLTELRYPTQFEVCASGAELPPATTVTLPVSSLDMWEPYEGMLLTIQQTLYVSDNYSLGRYGELALSVNDRLWNPTNVAEPGADAWAVRDLNDRSRIMVDDASNWENPDPLPPYFMSDLTLRAGDTTPSLTGVLYYSYGDYMIEPTVALDFTRANPRTVAPSFSNSTIKVASMNVLNYFTTLVVNEPYDGYARGAYDMDEFVRQQAKIVSAITQMDADVIGLMEIENNDSAALANLVDALNAVVGAGTYAYIDTGTIGTDAITVALIYKPANATPVGSFAVLDSSVDPTFLDTKNRPALAQTFMDNTTEELFTVAVNHLKSKGSDCNDIGDPDTGDLQGNCNITRTNAAIALANWLAGDPTGSGDADFLIIGDLNAYAKEDPIDALKDAGYINLIEENLGLHAYSYTYYGEAGYLDHALSTASFNEQLRGIAHWHINADEPAALDYNDYNQAVLYHPDPYRSSDHDPVVIGFCTDTTPPDLVITVTPDTLQPPNHKMADVVANVIVLDKTYTELTLVSVTSNEPDDDLGDGNTEEDIIILDDFNFQLRSERSGLEEGRIYTITYRAVDYCGNVTVESVQVFVPHDNGNDVCKKDCEVVTTEETAAPMGETVTEEVVEPENE